MRGFLQLGITWNSSFSSWDSLLPEASGVTGSKDFIPLETLISQSLAQLIHGTSLQYPRDRSGERGGQGWPLGFRFRTSVVRRQKNP